MNHMKSIILIMLSTFFLISCSSTVNGVDKDIYNKTEEYASLMLKIIEDENAYYEIRKEHDNISHLLDAETTNIEDEDVLKHFSIIHSLYVRAIAEYQIGGITDETKQELIETVDYLNKTYEMNIE